MKWVVKFEGVSKTYRRGGASYASLRSDLAQLGRRTLAFLRGGSVAPQGTLALNDVSFEVAEGEAFALIGPNGAGKTTSLKLLTRICYPTGGRIRVRGRVAALIEVGSGIHPELTGRENIWLYGRIMGMPRREIIRRFDEIVDFSELAHALDTPVKMYSSGMQLRLGFAIASHLDPDVFVIDEALSVGDAAFQAKSVERMMYLVTQGRTLIFVSHNLQIVEALCSRGLFLLNGRVETMGESRRALRAYLQWVDETQRQRKTLAAEINGRGLTVERVTLHNPLGPESSIFASGEIIEVRFHVRAEREIVHPWFCVGVNDGRPGTLIHCSMVEQAASFHIPPGHHVVHCRLGPLPLRPRTYEVWMSVRDRPGMPDLVNWSRVGAFRISLPDGADGVGTITDPWLHGPVSIEHQWSLDRGMDGATSLKIVSPRGGS